MTKTLQPEQRGMARGIVARTTGVGRLACMAQGPGHPRGPLAEHAKPQHQTLDLRIGRLRRERMCLPPLTSLSGHRAPPCCGQMLAGTEGQEDKFLLCNVASVALSAYKLLH